MNIYECLRKMKLFREAKIALKMKFFKGDINEEASPPSSNGLSKEILRDIEKKSLYREPADSKSIIPFAITIILIVLLLIILMRI